MRNIWKKYTPYLLAILLLQTPFFAAAEEDDKPLRLITVKGEAKGQLVPDEAIIHLQINGRAEKLPQAKNRHDARLKHLIALLKKHDVPENKLRTQHASSQPIYQYDQKKNEQRFEGYLVQSRLTATIRNLDTLGALLDALNKQDLEEDARRYGSFLQMQYSVSNPDVLRDKLLAKAIDNARVKARRMANAAGADLGRVHRIYEQNGNYAGQYRGYAQPRALAVAAEVAPTPPAGEEEITAQVNVTFELK